MGITEYTLPAVSVNKGYVCPSSITHPGETQDEKAQDILTPESWGAYQKNDFSEPRLLHLSMHRKALNSLNWDSWFSLINSNLLMFWLLGLCCRNSHVSQLLPYLFGAVFQRLYSKLNVLGFVPWIKHNSQLSGCEFLFNRHRGIDIKEKRNVVFETWLHIAFRSTSRIYVVGLTIVWNEMQ